MSQAAAYKSLKTMDNYLSPVVTVEVQLLMRGSHYRDFYEMFLVFLDG